MNRPLAFKQLGLIVLLLGFSFSAHAKKKSRHLVAVSPVERPATGGSDFFDMPDFDAPAEAVDSYPEIAPAQAAPAPAPEVVASAPTPATPSAPAEVAPAAAADNMGYPEIDGKTEAAAIVGAQCPYADGRCNDSMVALPQHIDMTKIEPRPAKPKKVAKLDYPPDVAIGPKDAKDEPHPASSYANRVAQASYAAAAKCRDFAQFRKKRMGLKTNRVYNSCKFFGKNNAFHSKSLCATGVREALSEAGIHLPLGNAVDQKRNLARAGLVKVKYEPYKVPSGTVIVCGGGHGHNYGDIQIVSDDPKTGVRRFCSDFCSVNPVCSDGWHRNPEAYKFPGS